MSGKMLCWCCQIDVSREVHEWVWGQLLCMGCVKQIKDFAFAIRTAALNDR